MHYARRFLITVLLCLAPTAAIAVPSITSLSPTSGAVGAVVIITGSSFGSPQGTSTVKFNGTTASPTSWSTTSITVPVPSGATTGNVIVTVSGKSSNGILFTVLPTPSISSVTPSSGLVGTSVTIAGSNFGSSQGGSTVKFNGVLATPSSWAANSIVVPVPAGATTGNVVVHASGVDTNGVLFTVPPNITSLSPTSGAVGTSVVITGTNFGSAQGSVTFSGSTGTISSWTDTSITAIVPAGATTGNVVVTAVGGAASSGVAFTVTGPPTISALNPASGAALASVTISGSNFGASQGNGSVTFNGLGATVSSWSATSIVVIVPAAATSGNVLVTAAGGVVSNGVAFTVTNPHINNLSVTSGTPGTSVTVTGFNFGAAQGGSTITFNGALAVPTSWSDTSIAVPVPSGATSGFVVVTVAGQPSNGVTFTVVTPPVITAVNPSSGAIGNVVDVTGSNFGATQGSSTISFHGVTATPNTWSPTTIVVPVPAGATSGNVVVTVNGSASNGVAFTVNGANAAPIITSISPSSGAAGTNVTFTGSNFGASMGNSQLFFSGNTEPVAAGVFPSTWTTTSFIGQVPNGAVTGPVFVFINGQASNGVCFATTSSTPCISALSPASGGSGASVTISGINFGSRQGQSTVKLNGVTATVTSWGVTSIAFTVPANVSSGNVVVTVGGIVSNGVPFTVPGPAITNISPDAGKIGNSVTITGTAFGSSQGSSTVKFNGTTATPTSWTNTTIVVPVPTGATTGPVVVTVNNQASVGANFTVTSAPSISSLSPTSGTVNTMVTVAGSGFGSPQGSGTVSFGGTIATPFSWSDSSISVPVPSGATTGSVVVTAGGTPSNGSTFTVTPSPSITSLSATTGAAGTSITITGSNFGSSQGSSAVKFNGLPAATTAWATGSISATVPSGVTTGPVTVTVNGQTSNGITFTPITTGGLSGTVTNAVGGAAISGATVQVLQNGAVKGTATTNGAGSYSISNVAAGSYDEQVSAAGFGTALQSSIAITANQTATSNVSLSAPGTISGTVTQSDGVSPIAGATVQVLVGRANGTAATTDVNGAYSITGLSAATYTVQASATGYVTRSQPVTLAGGGSSTANFAMQTSGNGAINYMYDELGRLVGVVDASGDAATYTYDAVGNILSIGRLSFAQISIINFTPASGLVGATVTINGTGFSTTASQNTVRFNGVSGTVTSSTGTQIIASVPSGATTGPISVTSPAGSATSSANFTVKGSSAAPTIASFTPTSGLAGSIGVAGSGTAVTITGTNFDTAVANDKITFNVTRADTKTATATQLTTNVPSSTGSGHITVATANGSAVSSQDFFVPFGSHGTADIGFTGRTTLGNSATVTLSTASKIGLLLFDATAGQGVSLQLSGSTFAACTLYIFDPTGKQLVSSACTSSTTSISSVPLLLAGTYTIGIEDANSTGSITIGLTPDVTATIAIDGPPVTVTTTVAGQNARLNFTATAGQRIFTQGTNFTTNQCNINLVRPDGTQVGLLNEGTYSTNPTIDTQSLPISGTYQFLIQCPSSGGSETLQIFSVPQDINGGVLTVTGIGTTGSAGTVTTTKAGQNAFFTFTGTAGSVLDFNVTSTSYTGCGATVYDPSNRVVNGFNCAAVATSFPIPLSLTGTYTLVIDPAAAFTGSATVSITNASDVTATATIDGPSVTTTTTISGQDARISFTATAGQKIMVFGTNFTVPVVWVNLVRPDGTNQVTFLRGGGSQQTVFEITADGFMIDVQTLATTGTYQIWMQHANTNVGSETIQIVSQPADVTGSIAIDGSAVTVSPALVGQDARLSFSATAGQRIVAYASNVVNNAFVNLVQPSGATQASVGISSFNTADSPAMDTQTLATTGTYQLWIQHNFSDTGSKTLQIVSVPPDMTDTITIDGAPVTATISAVGQDARLSFSATAGQRIVVYATNVTYANSTVGLMKPDGTQQNYLQITNSPAGLTFFLDTQTLATTGTYQLFMRHVSNLTGSATFQIASVPADFSGSVTIGGASIRVPATGNTAPGQNANITFSATNGQSVTVNVTNPTFGASATDCNLTVFTPNGFQATFNQTCGVGSNPTVGFTANQTGTYKILIDPQGPVTGSVTISVVSP
jgi:YD repeat-containing protein